MANLAVKDGTGATVYMKETGAGDSGDPHVPHVEVDQVIPGTGATDLGKAEDGPHSTGDVGVMALSVRQNTAAALGGTDADYQPLITDASGRLHCVNSDIEKAEDAGHTTGDKGIMALAVRQDTLAALAGTTADYIPLTTDSLGQLRTSNVGATTYANGQVSASTSAATLLAARATRRSVIFKNHDASITVYIGAATVSSSNGMAIAAGESIKLYITTLIQVISASGTPVVSYIEEYDA